MSKKSSKRQDRTRYPLPSPIDDGSRICVKLYIPNIRGHRAAFYGAIYNLTRWYSWEFDDAKQGRLAAAVWFDIYAEMMDNWGTECPDDKPCHVFSPAAQFIEYFPNNPYTSPDFIGEGYNAPAWYLATVASNLVLGTQTGDVVTDLSRFPPGSLPSIIPASGLPRIRINLTGTGLARLTLLNLLGGSLAQITVDDDLGTLRFIDLNRDQIAAPFETATETITEVEITTPGSHHIDIIIVSQINDSIPFLHHGGGLRQVELCGFESMVTMPNPLFRFTEECNLEISFNGTDWSAVPGWAEFASACFTGPAGPAGPTGETGPAGPEGPAGPAGESVSTKCRSATALIEGLWQSQFSPMLQALVVNLADDEPDSVLKETIEFYWGQQAGECDLILDNLIDFIQEFDEPGLQLQTFVDFNLEDDSQRRELIFGAECWMCDDGGIPDNVNEFVDAFFQVHPVSAYTLWAELFRFALLCNRERTSAEMSSSFYIPGCLDCSDIDSEVTCEQWTAAIGSYVHSFSFYESDAHFFPVSSGPAHTIYSTGEGFKPEGGTGNNNACIAVTSTSEEFKATQIDIGLAAPYPVLVSCRLLLLSDETGVPEEYIEHSPAGTDFWTFPLTTGITYDNIQVEILVDDGSPCDEIQASMPILRYITLYGVGTDPYS